MSINIQFTVRRNISQTFGVVHSEEKEVGRTTPQNLDYGV